MNATYDVRIDARVARELRRIPATDAERLIKAIEALRKKPRPRGVRKLVNQPGWRIRSGNYRILYEIDDKKKRITVFRAGHRREVYR